MAISSISSATTIAPQATAPAKADSDNSTSDKSSTTPTPVSDQSSSASTPSAPVVASTVLTQGSGSAHHPHKKHHALPGHPGHQVTKSA